MILALATLLTAPALAVEYKKLDSGVGNCIFSTGQLLLRQEAGYTDVRSSYKAGEMVGENRCYFPTQLQELAKVGRLSNSIRDEGKYWAQVIMTGSSPEDMGVNVILPGQYSSANADWDQQRLIISSATSNCSIKSTNPKTGKPNGCLDIEMAARSLKDKRPVPFTAHTCITWYYRAADKIGEWWDETAKAKVQGPIVEIHNFSTGCFDYVIDK